MHDLMSPQPASLTQEVLAGLIERVTYHNAENGFCVLRTKARGHRDVVTVVAGHGRQRCSTRSPERARSRSAFLRSTSV